MSAARKSLTISEAQALRVTREILSGEQLELDLDDVRRTVASAGPWQGVPPRLLTKSFARFSLGAPPPWGLRAKR